MSARAERGSLFHSFCFDSDESGGDTLTAPADQFIAGLGILRGFAGNENIEYLQTYDLKITRSHFVAYEHETTESFTSV